MTLLLGVAACDVGEITADTELEELEYDADDDADFETIETLGVGLTAPIEPRAYGHVGRTFHHEPCGLTEQSAFRVTLIVDVGELRANKFYVESIRRKYTVTDNDPEVVRGALYSWSGTTDKRKDVSGGDVFNSTGTFKTKTKVKKWYGTTAQYPAGVQTRSHDMGDCCPDGGCIDELQILPPNTL